MSKKAHRRYQEHCRGESSVPVSAWVQELKDHEFTPDFRIVEEGIPGEIFAVKREWYWTKFFLMEGASLLNNISPFVREKYAAKREDAN